MVSMRLRNPGSLSGDPMAMAKGQQTHRAEDVYKGPGGQWVTRDKQSVPSRLCRHTQVKEWEVGGAGPGAPQQFQVSSLGEVIPPALVHMPNQASGLVWSCLSGH